MNKVSQNVLLLGYAWTLIVQDEHLVLMEKDLVQKL